MRFSWSISRYLIQSILPYFLFSWVLLTVILFVQQASRFSDIFFSANIPTTLIWQLTFALVPNVIAFTCPMAILVGVVIGLSKMQGDSELAAIRAAGVGNFQITVPIAILGVLLSLFAFLINLYGVPFAARIVRKVAVQTAIFKLESPIEPGVFNTELAGLTIYVKHGDLEEGRWKNIFIHNEDEKSRTTRLITSNSGRIDYSGDRSELVLENAVSTTITETAGDEKFISENIGEIRFVVQTRRGELIEKLSSAELTPEELGLSQLSEYAGGKEGAERTEAQILWQRRIVLSVTPFIFCLLGTALVLRFTRRGRSFGIFVALASLILYYLLAFFGEQLARTGTVDVFTGSLIPIAISFTAVLWLNFANRRDFFGRAADRLVEFFSGFRSNKTRVRRSNLFVDLATGLRDFDLVLNLLKYYLLSLGFLSAVFIIFTAFELWKFAGTTDGGIVLLVKYLFFLLPFIYLQLTPSAAMIATLATYVIKSRQNEIVTWISAGQSVYRLLLPCFVFMVFLGGFNWLVQEWVAPRSNQVQDSLRGQLRNRGIFVNASGKYWVANDKKIYSFKMGEAAPDESLGSQVAGNGVVQGVTSDNDISNVNIESSIAGNRINLEAASDNEMKGTRNNPLDANKNIVSPPASDNERQERNVPAVSDLTVYEFADKGANLQALYRGKTAIWDDDRIRFTGGAKKTVISEGKLEILDASGAEIVEESNPFAEVRKKPSHLNLRETRSQLANSEADVERRSFAVALEKKYATLFVPFIIALFTAPFALSLSRKGKVITVGYAVGLWLLFMGITSTFEQFGLSGALASGFAVWGPLVFFSMLGIYMLSKVKT